MENNTITPAPASIENSAIETLKASLRGTLLQPGEVGYDQARTVWNGMIDKHPALIVKCAGPSDVIQAVNFAREHNLIVSVKGGGHSFAGKSVCDAGLMIDLSSMRSIWVDLSRRTARAEAGALLSDLDHETQAFGLATTGGTVSHTGIAGLTLGGGQGWLMNKYGLTVDNLLSVDIVLADGRMLTASKSENEDLFWAVRGGGGNFGVVTSFEYQLHPVGPQILGGMILYPMDKAMDVLRFYRTYSMETPEELSSAVGIITSPEGLPLIAVVVAWIGDMEEGEQHIKALREFDTPLADMIGPMPYTQMQKIFDAAVPHGMHRYTKMGYLPHLEDDLLEMIVRHSNQVTSPYSIVLLNCMKDAAAKVDPADTAFAHRGEQWHFDIVAQWTNPSEASKHISWARSFWQEAESFTNGTGINFLDADDGSDRVKLAFGANYERLAQLKQKYDPTNFFRLNNNVLPKSYLEPGILA
ncbi:FAD-binding oxidoreductase [Pontibacter toksunensis]|uniref:FAD-binding oxidoreductase n=1 Tax=Pontibacter toksunensis TaxID=1332631 RepID=A0ABW6C3P0_9BACT